MAEIEVRPVLEDVDVRMAAPPDVPRLAVSLELLRRRRDKAWERS